MSDRDNIQSLLALRKLTRTIADAVRAQMAEYLATISPLLRPTAILGDYIQGGVKESPVKTDRVFKEVLALYQAIAPAKPFSLPRDLATPFNFPSVNLEITPVEYMHGARDGANTRNIAVKRPLSWTLAYSGCAPSRVAQLVGDSTKMRATDELQKLVLGNVILHAALNSLPGLLHMFDGLHFPITTDRLPEFGDLPITRVGVAISTARPSDAVVIESAELTGVDAFEEVVTLEDIAGLSDPFKERLLGIAGV